MLGLVPVAPDLIPSWAKNGLSKHPHQSQIPALNKECPPIESPYLWSMRVQAESLLLLSSPLFYLAAIDSCECLSPTEQCLNGGTCLDSIPAGYDTTCLCPCGTTGKVLMYIFIRRCHFP